MKKDNKYLISIFNSNKSNKAWVSFSYNNKEGFNQTIKSEIDYKKILPKIDSYLNTIYNQKWENLEKSDLFSNMSFTQHGKGYLLTPNDGESNPNWGYTGSKDTDYFHGGWWRDDLGGWFFRGSMLNVLEDNGAVSGYSQSKSKKCKQTKSSTPIVSPKPKSKSVSKSPSLPFTNMSFTQHGKGYLLTPNDGESNPNWGYTGSKDTDYFHGGWWRDDLGGWFFRGSMLNVLEDNGANKVTPDGAPGSGDEVSSDENMTISQLNSSKVMRSKLKNNEFMEGVYYTFLGSKKILVFGNTYYYQKTLKSLGGIFNRTFNGFFFKFLSKVVLKRFNIKYRHNLPKPDSKSSFSYQKFLDDMEE